MPEYKKEQGPDYRTYLREVKIKFRKKRIKNELIPDMPLTEAKQVVDIFYDMQDESKEKMIAVSLDSNLKIISFEIVGIGAVTTEHIKPFEVIRSSVALNAFGVILIHNHISGDSKPDSADINFTAKMKELTTLGGLNFLDHIIIGDGNYYSFAEEGFPNFK